MNLKTTDASSSSQQADRIKQYLATAGATAATALLATSADAALVQQTLNIPITDGSVVPIDLDGDLVTDFTLTHTQLGFLAYDNQALYISSNSPGSEVAFFDVTGYGWVMLRPMTTARLMAATDSCRPVRFPMASRIWDSPTIRARCSVPNSSISPMGFWG